MREEQIEKEIEKAPGTEIEKVSSRIEKEEAFSIFWKLYPRKDSKVPAQKAYEKLNPSAELQQQILDAVQRFKGCDQWVREGGKFIPFASTWLNQKRWEDEPMAATPLSNVARMSPQDRRRAISTANGDAWLAGTPQFDPNVIDMEH